MNGQHMSMVRLSTALALWFAVIPIAASAASCLYINSYHKGYDWSDRMQGAFNEAIKHQCSVSYHYLDAKHQPIDKLKAKGMEIANLIPLSQPDIVIAADDAASQYVVQPYLRNSRVPVVYIGVNWDPRPFGYPMDNATGMTEMWPVEQVLSIVEETTGSVKTLAMVTKDGIQEHRNAQVIAMFLQQKGITFTPYFVNTFAEWQSAVVKAQQADVIYLGTFQAIRDWNVEQAQRWMQQENHRLTLASQDFMLPYVMFSLSKSPEEFAHWASEAVSAILSGTQPWQIPIIPNQQLNYRYNPTLLSKAGFHLPDRILRRARPYEGAP